MPETPILEARSLCRVAADGQILIDSADFRIAPGDRLTVTGASGSGKSVFLRALARLDPVQSGDLLWNGSAVAASRVPDFRSRVIYLHQRPSLFEGTVESNLKRPFDLRVHAGKSFDRDQVLRWLNALNRDADFLNRRQQDLSGGEQQIVALLRAIQLRPQVLLLDEPTAALDDGASTAVERLIEQWVSDDVDAAFVWVTHSQPQAQRLGSARFRMDSGILSEAGAA